MRFKTWAWGLSVATAALLAACGGGSDSSSAQMRLLNASIGYAALDMAVDSTTVNAGVTYAGVGSYADVKTDATGTEVQSNSVGSTLSSSTPSLASGSHYTMIAYGSAGSVRTTLLQEDQDVPATGKSKLLVLPVRISVETPADGSVMLGMSSRRSVLALAAVMRTRKVPLLSVM